MQNQIKGFKIPSNQDKANFKKDESSNKDTDQIGIKLVRFDDENKRTSSVKVSLAPFLVPLSQSVPVFLTNIS